MEVRPIDAKALYEFIQKEKAWKQDTYRQPRYGRGKADAFYEMLDIINEQPTLDYEPVVRCKDCKHRNKEYSETFCEVLGRLTNDNFYCSYGAKMDEEVDDNVR